jgi:4,5-DOPA dioxygenase extradiol
MIPAMFLCHGSPFLAVQQNEYSQFLNQLGKKYTPKAIVIFSAHWESNVLSLTYTDDVLDTVYDYSGFPKEFYEVKYPAKGSKIVAEMLEQRFADAGIATKREEERGLDHGSWVMLKHMYPDANIPIVQLSVNERLSPKEQYEIGKALAGLEHEDILVIGSGTTVHNLRWIFFHDINARPEAVAFDEWLIAHTANWDIESLNQYETLAPHAKLAVPRAEHFVPYFIAMGAGNLSRKPTIINRSYEHGTFSNLCYEF